MSISTSSALSTIASGDASQNTTQATRTQPQPQPATDNSGYTVKLSEVQQVYKLYNQGQEVSQIAATLNLSVAAVNNYLGINSST